MFAVLVAPFAQAAAVTIPRWGRTLVTPSEATWTVEDVGERVTVLRDGDGAGFVLRVRPASGCGAAVASAPVVPGLPTQFAYAGNAGGDRWCMGAPDGTIELAFVRAADDEVVALLVALVAEPLSALAQAPALERKPRYSLIVYPTLRGYMPAQPSDVVPGRAALRLDWAYEHGEEPSYGNGPGLAADMHAMRTFAVGVEAGAAWRSLPGGRSGVLYEARAMVGAGGWPHASLGVAGLLGVGVDGLGSRVRPSVSLPVEAVLMLGTSRVGLEVLARTQLGLGPESWATPGSRPLDGQYLRVAGWLGEANTEPRAGYVQDGSGYTDYGRRAFWAGGYVREQWDARWVGVTVGYGLMALPVR